MALMEARPAFDNIMPFEPARVPSAECAHRQPAGVGSSVCDGRQTIELVDLVLDLKAQVQRLETSGRHLESQVSRLTSILAGCIHAAPHDKASAVAPPTSAPGLGSRLPHLHLDSSSQNLPSDEIEPVDTAAAVERLDSEASGLWGTRVWSEARSASPASTTRPPAREPKLPLKVATGADGGKQAASGSERTEGSTPPPHPFQSPLSPSHRSSDIHRFSVKEETSSLGFLGFPLLSPRGQGNRGAAPSEAATPAGSRMKREASLTKVVSATASGMWKFVSSKGKFLEKAPPTHPTQARTARAHTRTRSHFIVLSRPVRSIARVEERQYPP